MEIKSDKRRVVSQIQNQFKKIAHKNIFSNNKSIYPFSMDKLQILLKYIISKMRIFTVIIAFFLVGNIFGQVERVPLDYNPILFHGHKEKIRYVEHETHKTHTNLRDSETFLRSVLVNGDTLSIKVDTSSFANGGVFEIIQNPGMAVLDTTQLNYIPSDATLWRADTISIQTCDTVGKCDTLVYPVLVKRPNTSIVGESHTVDPFDVYKQCLDSYVDLNDFASMSFGNCDASDFRTETNFVPNENCFEYAAGGSTDEDDVCVVVCNNHFICDTINFHFTVVSDTLTTLPFFDDFSSTDPLPSTENWVTRDAFVNTSWGMNPPSLGVASFDGVSDKGAAYGGSFGLSDQLESKYIDLNSYSSTDGLNLIFFLEMGGNAFEKPKQNDHFMVEFKDDQGEWVMQEDFTAMDSRLSSDNFTKIVIPVNQEKYLYGGFQFRFSNFSQRTGIVGVWNLDYVLLDKIGEGTEIKDLAFTHNPKSLLAHYTHMPLSQFKGNEEKELASKVDIVMYSQFDVEVAAEPSTLNVIDLVSNTPVLADAELLTLDGNTNQRNVSPKTQVSYSNDLPNRSSLIDGIKNNLNGQDSVVLEMTYHFEQTAESTMNKVNNTAKRLTFLTDFYAYDDGVAESAIAAKGPGTEVAVKYHANVGDSLRSVQFFIPHYKYDVSNQSLRIKVWINLDEAPIFESDAVPAIYANRFSKDVVSFTNYPLRDNDTGIDSPVYIPAGDFYVGWEQVSNAFNTAIAIGYDENSTIASVKKFRGLGAEWEDFQLTPVNGALMIRPVFGKMTLPLTFSEDIHKKEKIEVQPNPTNGWIDINLDGNNSDYQYELYNALGQQIQSGILTSSIDFQKERNGVYFLQIRDNRDGFIVVKKLIKE